VVAEDGVDFRGLEGGEDFGAAVRRVTAGYEGERAACYEVPGNQDDVGREAVDAVDDVLKEEGFSELIEVNVGELNDAETVKGLRELVDAYGGVDDIKLVTRDPARIKSEACRGDAGAQDESAAG
jgi:hypothetical protein